MATVSIKDVTQDPTTILARAEAGESFIVLHADRPVVEIRPVHQPDRESRPFGLCAGEFTVPEDFDAPLPEHVIDSFEAS
jgi:antitoxin (DNA-binding transcriptional repressor) of toxin-antitoxin stability system